MVRLNQIESYCMVAVAQLVEHLVVVQAVAGPSPVSHPIYFEYSREIYFEKLSHYQKIRPKAWFFVFDQFLY